MPSKAPPPVLQDWAGWSPYQQQTSAARVIESPMPAMLLGRLGAADATGAVANSPTREPKSNHFRITAPQFCKGEGGIPVLLGFHTGELRSLSRVRAGRRSHVPA